MTTTNETPDMEAETHRIDHDGFEGTVIGSYVTREGKRGVVLQQVGTKVVHVYGEKWIATPPKAPIDAGVVEALRKVLAPFADQADTHSPQMPDEMFIDDYEHPPGQPWKSLAGLTIGDLRRARQALAASQSEGDKP